MFPYLGNNIGSCVDSINRLVGMVVDLKLPGLTKHYDAAAALSDTSLILVGGLTDLTDERLDDLSWRHNRARLEKVEHGGSGHPAEIRRTRSTKGPHRPLFGCSQ